MNPIIQNQITEIDNAKTKQDVYEAVRKPRDKQITEGLSMLVHAYALNKLLKIR